MQQQYRLYCWMVALTIFIAGILCAQSNTLRKNKIDGIEIPAAIQHRIDSLKALLPVSKIDEKLFLYGKICWQYLVANDLISAKKYADTLSLLAIKENDSTFIIKAEYYYGVINRVSGNYREALPHLENYISYHQHHGDSASVAGGLFQVGSIQQQLGNYEASLATHYRSLEIEEKAHNDYSIGYTLNSIGNILKEQGKFKDAENAYQRSLLIMDTLREWFDKVITLANLGNLYTETDQLDAAQKYYKEALQLNRAIGKKEGIATTLANIAYLFNKLNNYDSALYYHLQGLGLREQLESKENIARSLMGVGLGYGKLNNTDAAIRYLLKAEKLSGQIGSKPILRDVYKGLAEQYAIKNEYKKSYTYQQLYTEVSDSLVGESTKLQVGELQAKYETAEKDRKIALLANANALQQQEVKRASIVRKALIGGLFLLIIIGMLGWYLFRQRLKHQQLITTKNQAIKEAEFSRQKTNLEMQALRAQINPHFLFNCMNSINRLVLEGESEKASVYLSKFSKLVRLILENAGAATISLDDELKLLEAYIQLESLRFKGKINYHLVVDDNVDQENIVIPSMILQPFVENAIWHGLMHKPAGEPGNISVKIIGKDDRLYCSIEDNGIGREKARQLKDKSVLKQTSLGMQITRERLQLLDNENAGEIIRITDLKNEYNQAEGTRVELSIPVS